MTGPGGGTRTEAETKLCHCYWDCGAKEGIHDAVTVNVPFTQYNTVWGNEVLAKI